MELLATFPSSHAALQAEQELKVEGLPAELIPVPSQIHGDCGFCLLVPGGEGEAEAERRLERLRSCGANGLWRVTATQAGPSSRKVKSYERYP